MKTRILPLLTFVLSALLANPASVAADTPAVGPTFRLMSVEAQIEWSDVVAVTHLTFAFQGAGDAGSREVDLEIPLSYEAVVTKVELVRDDKVLVGSVKEKQVARAEYQAAVQRQDDAVLIESAGKGLLDLHFNIAAGGAVFVHLTWVEPVVLENGRQTYELPLNAVARFAPLGYVSVHAVLTASHPWTQLTTDGAPFVIPANDGRRVSLTYSAESVQDVKDIRIQLTPSSDAYRSVLLLSERAADAAALLALRVPNGDGAALPLDVVFVLDRSGSMGGGKMEQARDALIAIMDQLRDQDRFALVNFDDVTATFRESLAQADGDSREAAKKWIKGIDARGGTNIDSALERGLKVLDVRSGDSVPVIILITDGQPTVGETDREKIIANFATRNAQDVRLHTVGIGFDREEGFLNRLAEKNRGTYRSIGPAEDVRVALADFYARIATPMLKDVRLTIEGIEFKDLQPTPIPDAYADSHLLVLGRLDASALPEKVKVIIEATAADGPFRLEQEIDVERAPLVPETKRLWARAKANALEHEQSITNDVTRAAALRVELLALGLDYQVATTSASWVVTDLKVATVVDPAPPAIDQFAAYDSTGGGPGGLVRAHAYVAGTATMASGTTYAAATNLQLHQGPGAGQAPAMMHEADGDGLSDDAPAVAAQAPSKTPSVDVAFALVGFAALVLLVRRRSS